MIAASSLFCSTCAFAQNSVTLYGIIDNGIGYQSNQTTLGSTSGGHSNTKMITGVWNGSRFGFRGAEDLGGGTKTIFVLEAGFNTLNGAQATSGLIFNRQAYVGLTNNMYGSLTVGRQYISYYQMLSPFSPTTWLTGYFGAHPGDIDALDVGYRTNNTILYTSPTFNGLKFSGSYSLAGVPGSVNRGSTWATGIQYQMGPAGVGVGFSRMNNSTLGGGAFGAESTTSNNGLQTNVSSINNGYQTAQAQQRFAVGAGYKFGEAFNITATYANVQFIPGIGSKFHDTEIFNVAGVTAHWRPSPAWDLAAGYNYTQATKANGISDSAMYHQFTTSQFYSLSKKTGIYAAEAYQRASGNTLGTNGAGNIIQATASIGDGFNSTPSASRNMFAFGVGLLHRF
ncbi:porin [Burkholderia cenocepacia]|uniref:porin n=1 Tax=Burkholderia cenocepacia TaxID=95486 RepID=UPI001B9FFAF9|nr:porin [Burkholderia cenocepacia]MBR8030136.1 porin [Burkholderia cenocepacia]MBR8174014.1 porin [Burkholderia cenocepacia]